MKRPLRRSGPVTMPVPYRSVPAGMATVATSRPFAELKLTFKGKPSGLGPMAAQVPCRAIEGRALLRALADLWKRTMSVPIASATTWAAQGRSAAAKPELAELARRNVELHTLGQRVSIEQADIKNIRSLLPAESFDAAVANPPFYPLGTGRINPGSQEAGARHELLATLSDFVCAASYMLKNGGRLCAIFSASRSTDLICTMRANNIEPKALRCVHSRAGESAAMVLAEGLKNAGSGVEILPPLVIYSAGRTYSPEVKSIFSSL